MFCHTFLSLYLGFMIAGDDGFLNEAVDDETKSKNSRSQSCYFTEDANNIGPPLLAKRKAPKSPSSTKPEIHASEQEKQLTEEESRKILAEHLGVKQSSSNTGKIVGGILGALVFIALIVAGVIVTRKKRALARKANSNVVVMEDTSAP